MLAAGTRLMTTCVPEEPPGGLNASPPGPLCDLRVVRMAAAAPMEKCTPPDPSFLTRSGTPVCVPLAGGRSGVACLVMVAWIRKP